MELAIDQAYAGTGFFILGMTQDRDCDPRDLVWVSAEMVQGRGSGN